MSEFKFLTKNEKLNIDSSTNDTVGTKRIRMNISKEKSVSDEVEIRKTDHLEGLPVGQFVHSAPMIFTQQGHNMWFGDMYRGKSAFLILGAPSFKTLLDGHSEKYGSHYEMLKHPGFITMGVNNSVKTFRPDLWVSADEPDKFLRSTWQDPKIMKFVPYEHVGEKIFDTNQMKHLDIQVGNCPNTWFFRRNELFNEKQFMFEDTFNWGNSPKHGGKRSVMLIAMRLLYYLGIRNVYLLGCDFYMSSDYTYHFDQERHKSSVRGNNATYKALSERFTKLLPIFKKLNYNVFNCNPKSELKVFPIVEFEEAWERCLSDFPIDLDNENTAGLYDRAYKKRMLEQGKDLDSLY